MKKGLALILSLLLLFCFLYGCQKEEVSMQTGDPILASFSATDMDGNIVDQQVLAGHKLTMINIWATFCGPCIREMPDLAQLSDAYGDDFQIIGIVMDVTDRNMQVLPETKLMAQDIIDSTGADYLHLLPSQSLNKAYLSKVQAVPETIFVDSSGNQVGQSYVGSKSKAQWQSIIESLLEQMQ